MWCSLATVVSASSCCFSEQHAGPSAVADLKNALENIMPCFRPGRSSWLNLILGKKIDRILFAATKADHLHQTSHDRLEAILRLLLDEALARSQSAGARIDVAGEEGFS